MAQGTLVTEYADDIAIAAKASSADDCVRLVQTGLNLLCDHLNELGLIISIQNTKAITFTNKLRVDKPDIFINNETIKYTQEFTFLGIQFDAPHLNWKSHISKIC